MNRDSKYTNIELNLNAIGKKVFVDFYYDFKNPQTSTEELAEKLFRDNPLSRSTRQGFRIPRARHIFEMNQQIDALKVIVNSSRLSPETINKAKQILKEEIAESTLLQEHIEETEYLSLVNNEVAYYSGEPVTYSKTPKMPKYTSRSLKQPVRDPKVSRNALLIADFKCEINKSHLLFKRKNSDNNYTEPHHIIPLSAQKDFPDISLDCEQNIVSLCCTCHKQVHYGADIDSILRSLYDKRYPLLKQIGINITYEELKEYYK